jgi:hypothetical protein
MTCYLIYSQSFQCAYEFRTVNRRSSTAHKSKVYGCSYKHRFANHTAVATADHKGAVLTLNIRVYLETVLLNKQEVIHEYVYT